RQRSAAPRHADVGGDLVSDLSPLTLTEWRPTRDRLQRWARLAGAVRRQRSPNRKHWWHIGLLPSARGLTTGPFGIPEGAAEIALDLVSGELALLADDGRETRLPLSLDPATDGFAGLRAGLAKLGADVD